MIPTDDIDPAGLTDVDYGPAEIAKYLLPKERCVATVRRHPAVLLAPSAQAVAGLLVAFILTATLLRGHGALIWIVWGLWAALLARLVWVAVNWAVDYFVITSKRILLTSGVFTRNIAMMPLSKVTDMSFRRSFTGRMLGYGDFVVESAGQDQALRTIDHIPYPESLYQKICDEIFFEKNPPKPPPCALDRLQPGDTFVISRRPGSGRGPVQGTVGVFDEPDDTKLFDQQDHTRLLYEDPDGMWVSDETEIDDVEDRDDSDD